MVNICIVLWFRFRNRFVLSGDMDYVHVLCVCPELPSTLLGNGNLKHDIQFPSKVYMLQATTYSFFE